MLFRSVSDGHVDVGAASDPGGDVVDVEVQVLVDAGLQAERSDDSGLVVLLRGLHVFLGHLERLVEKGLPEGGGVVSAYGVLGDDAVLLQFHLLFGGEPDVAVEGGLEPPVDTEELHLLPLLLERVVEEVEVEDGTDDVLLHPGVFLEVLVEDPLPDQLLGFLHVLVVVLGGEESSLELLDMVVDGGPCQVGVESTIIDLTCEPPRLLRPGGLPLEALEDVAGPIAVDRAVTQQLKEGEQPKAPGMKYRHYAFPAGAEITTLRAPALI